MLYDTIKEYNAELEMIKNRLNSMEKRMEKYPERIWIKANYDSLKQLYEIILNNRDEYLKIMDETINLHICESVDHDFSLALFSTLVYSIKDFSKNLFDCINTSQNKDFEEIMSIKEAYSGSLHLIFYMGDENTNLNEVKLNHDLFKAFFNIFECSYDDLPYLKDKYGEKCIEKYKNFLNILIEHSLRLVFKSNTKKVVITHNDALNIIERL